MILIRLIIITTHLFTMFNVIISTNTTDNYAANGGNDTNRLLLLKQQFDAARSLRELIKDEIRLELSKTLWKTNATEEWSSWSRCKNCKQTRTRLCGDCVNKLYEERPCDKKRCDRKLARHYDRKQMHVVKAEDLYETRSLSTHQRGRGLWTRWSEWTDCSPQCITYRSRICRMPERCPERKQKQHAYCYHERTKCETFVLNLYDSRRRQDYSIYQYDNNHGQQTVPKKKRKKTKFPHTARCGRPFRRSKMLKIIGGRVASKYKWPWHVAVLNRYMNVFCAGTLIHPRWVLTAGHCIRSYLIVRLNEHDLTAMDGREIDMIVTKSVLHPRFNHKTVDNDIALLKLPRSVRSPVACMPNRQPISTTKCTIIGWGKKRFSDRDGSPLLQEANVRITDHSTCSKSYKDYMLTSNMFCAGLPNGAADTCAGDSGGGLMCPSRRGKSYAYTVEGITSFGEGCGRANKYGIYTVVYNYVDWIKRTVEQLT